MRHKFRKNQAQLVELEPTGRVRTDWNGINQSITVGFNRESDPYHGTIQKGKKRNEKQPTTSRIINDRLAVDSSETVWP